MHFPHSRHPGGPSHFCNRCGVELCRKQVDACVPQLTLTRQIEPGAAGTPRLPWLPATAGTLAVRVSPDSTSAPAHIPASPRGGIQFSVFRDFCEPTVTTRD